MHAVKVVPRRERAARIVATLKIGSLYDVIENLRKNEK